MTSRRIAILLAFLAVYALAPSSGEAQAPRPDPPREYRVQLRYRIYAGRNQRIRQYYALVDYLTAIGFRKDPGEITEPEDPSETRMTGTIDSVNARKLLLDTHVKSVLLMPADYKLPDEGGVSVQMDIVVGLPLERQRLLFDQVRARLAELGFREYVGYDHRGFTRIVGVIPVAEVETLLKDLRYQPAGWLTPEVPVSALPMPLQTVSPILMTTVLPEPEGFPPAREPPAPPPPVEKGQENLQKISPDLRELTAKEDDKPRRLEVILNYSPKEFDRDWSRPLLRYDLQVEGRLGPLVTVLAPPKQALALAELPMVSTIRLPRPAQPQGRRPGGTKDGNLEALRASGLMHLHAIGHRGQGIRVGIIDGDFRGYQQLIGKQLPKTTRYVDLTAERNPTLLPDDFTGDQNALGHGAECALAAALAAPKAELVLIRIDPAAPHQLQAVARYVNGEVFYSESHAQRYVQLTEEKERLDRLRADLLVERKAVLAHFGTDKEADDKREAYRKKQAEFDAEYKAYHARLQRFLQLQRDYQDLKNLQIVTSSLVWNDGYPLGASSPVSRYFDDHPFRTAMWFQSAGNTRGQTWAGLFRDGDGNGVMEFAPLDTMLKVERWTPELNFLGWHPYGKKAGPELPEKVKLRLTMQWREVHDPEYVRQTEDVYREPLANLSMLVLRQRDPRGAKIPADHLEVVARSIGLPQRLENQPTYAIYEQAVEVTVEPGGRYALRVEGIVPTDIRPARVPTTPGMRKSWELRPRIFVDVTEPAFRVQGRAVFLDYPTDVGALGMPADSRNVLTVGAADSKGTPQAYSTMGPPLDLELLAKPDLLSFDDLLLGRGDQVEAFGASQASSFAAGLTAASLSAGADRVFFLRAMRERAGKLLRVP